MIEGIFSLIAAIVEGLIALVVGLIELISGTFTVGAEAMTAGEAIVVFLALIIEVILWGILLIVELIVCLFTWRKPKMAPKPSIYTRKPQQKNKADQDEQ